MIARWLRTDHANKLDVLSCPRESVSINIGPLHVGHMVSSSSCAKSIVKHSNALFPIQFGTSAVPVHPEQDVHSHPAWDSS